jgi:hypothetical protein
VIRLVVRLVVFLIVGGLEKMSLDFSVERMKNFNVLTTIIETTASSGGKPNRKWHPVTNALIFGTMPIGMNSITKDNWQEFYNRLNFWERTVGPQLWRGDIPQDDPRNRITPLEVYMHIGLGTNASNKTQAQFLKDCFAAFQDHSKYETKEAEVTYLGLSLDDISEEDWQKAWVNPDPTITRNTDSLIAKLRNPDAPIGALGPTESVTS